MLIKVTATIETVVEIKDDLDLTHVCEQAKDCVRSDCFEILCEDLGNSLEEQIPLATTVVKNKNDLPCGWNQCIPWHTDAADNDTELTCEQILRSCSDLA